MNCNIYTMQSGKNEDMLELTEVPSMEYPPFRVVNSHQQSFLGHGVASRASADRMQTVRDQKKKKSRIKSSRTPDS